MLKILVTGANGYIGKRLLPVLIEAGHEVYGLIRIKGMGLPESIAKKITVIEGDLLDDKELELPLDIDIAYYLVHSMAKFSDDFDQLEEKVAKNFLRSIKKTRIKQIIYLSGITNDIHLSAHLRSRLNVEKILTSTQIPVTILKASIIVGAGSASFEIIRDITEKLPVMVAPKWVNNLCQPIAIRDVVFYLLNVAGNTDCYSKTFDIGGAEVLTFKQVLKIFAEFRKLTRRIIVIPFLTPRLSSYWLYFISSVPFSLVFYLVESMKTNTVCKNFAINKIIPHECLSYREAIERAFTRIDENMVVSSWKDTWEIEGVNPNLNDYIETPKNGCFFDRRHVPLEDSLENVIAKIWALGGKTGWYVLDWAWVLRGFVDRIFGGVGLRRGRSNPTEIHPGDSLDFWRVVVADKKAGRLLLYAQMKLPGEAWLEFRIVDGEKGKELMQIATFRPRGLLGRLYWWALVPIHGIIFGGMSRAIAKKKSNERTYKK